MFKLGDTLFDKGWKQYKIVQNKKDDKFYLFDTEENEIIGEIYCTQVIYSEGETILT